MRLNENELIGNGGLPERHALVMPLYNEESRLKLDYIDRLLEIPDLHLFLIDDGSQDSTVRIARSYAERNARVFVETLEENQGKAMAILKGMQTAYDRGFSVIGQVDADASVSVEDVINGLRLCQMSPDVYLVSGARIRLAGSPNQRDPVRMWIGRIVATVIYFLSGNSLYDPQSPAKWWRFPPNARSGILVDFSTRWFGEVELAMRLREATSEKEFLVPTVLEFPLSVWVEVGGSNLGSFRSWFHVIRDLLSLVVISRKHRRSLPR
jgi:glycosyltransferase involved in cell wall biosynthesis